MFVPHRLQRFCLRLCGGILSTTALLSLSGAPVEFTFRVDATAENPFARDIWATVTTPADHVLRLPAFYVGDNQWSVRTRAALKGNYEFQNVSEQRGGLPTTLAAELKGRDRFRVRDIDTLGGPVRIDPRSGTQFIDGRGDYFQPLGGNLPWASGSAPASYYPAAFGDFATVGFNWTRVWMCHWGQLNLDWVEPANGPQPALGTLDLGVARRLDGIMEAAETHGVRIQLVLQHHGQYTTFNNTNWAENPWNSALGGFLDSPTDFFTNDQARELTRQKYRYIAARWGYSSAIMAWELFNEVMWTNARRGDAADNAAVAAWHEEMARVLRRYDVHGHLVTTSDDDLHHAMWTTMDYYQPHLYANDMVLGVQHHDLAAAAINRPVFYGEVGDDNMADLTSEQRTTGFIHPLLAWSGLFGETTQPAQIWYVETLRQQGRWAELQSLGRFVNASGLRRAPLPRVSYPTVLGDLDSSLKLTGGLYWHRGPAPELEVPTDGHIPASMVTFPRILTNAAERHPYPSRATFHVDYPAASVARLHLRGMSNRGGSLRITVDDRVAVDEPWPAAAEGRPTPTNQTFSFPVGYGRHTVVVENPVGADWIDLVDLDLGIPVPALTAVARHGADRVVLWVRHRDNLLSPASDNDLTPATGRIVIDDVPAGEWLVSWWDVAGSRSTHSSTVRHRGGQLTLATPPITRHAAAWLERVP
ncbi:DUF5060 domain-containing protein [Synoicihabitans lomoniglobus]|uniref:DUF5060 domain-containing protein n=1 Tax=Synoicihabitans lomoniglobus TaxID=2909285 RepID=A0AAE9ZU18_9BACT|nr:DUF5060 domain-containing protein [Opitutaceae bacterium LMO-M01]WED63029.1 DUF5060 domain-containing protein [Opitutaceae bacterium LMO-M01]